MLIYKSTKTLLKSRCKLSWSKKIRVWTNIKGKDKTDINWQYLGVVWEQVQKIPSEMK